MFFFSRVMWNFIKVRTLTFAVNIILFLNSGVNGLILSASWWKNFNSHMRKLRKFWFWRKLHELRQMRKLEMRRRFKTYFFYFIWLYDLLGSQTQPNKSYVFFFQEIPTNLTRFILATGMKTLCISDMVCSGMGTVKHCGSWRAYIRRNPYINLSYSLHAT
jgi:hypothetical protein